MDGHCPWGGMGGGGGGGGLNIAVGVVRVSDVFV